MRTSFCLSLATVWLSLGCGESGAIRDLAELQEAPLYTFREKELDLYLQDLAERPSPVVERVALLARKNIGQPYRIYLLGESPYELHDPDPMYCLGASDCVTFVEHTYAMALARDWSSFFRNLQRIRYKDGKVGMLTRNHFTEADWNINNAWLFEDVTRYVAGGKAWPMRALIDRAAFFRKYGIGGHLPVERFESRYVSKADVPEALERLQTGDVIEFIRGNESTQYVGHMGLLVRDDSGRVTLIHSADPAVREEPLLGYLQRHANLLGVKVLRSFRRGLPGDSQP